MFNNFNQLVWFRHDIHTPSRQILFANDLLTCVGYLNHLVNSYSIELEESVRMSWQFVLCSTLLNPASASLAVLNPASRHPVC